MAKHASGKRNYAISKELIVLVVVLALIGLAVWAWTNQRNEAAEEKQASTCIQGDLDLLVAASNPAASQLIERYNEASPIVRDYCVRAVPTNEVARASVYLTDQDDPTTQEVLQQAQRKASSDTWPTVDALPLGVAAPAGSAKDQAPRYPVASDPLGAALVADSKEQDPQAALVRDRLLRADATAAQRLPIATTERQTPVGYEFRAIDGLSKPLRAVPLAANDAAGEDATRAAADFSERLAEGAPQAASDDAVAKASSLVHSPAMTQRDTLFVLETSAAMDAGWFDPAVAGIRAASEALGTQQQALMNYSSPLSPGVTRGWRINIKFGPKPPVAQAAARLFTDGGRQTNEALGAALDVAQAHRVPTRIVLITTGSDDQASANLQDRLKAANAAGVEVRLVVLGNQPDQALMKAVESTGGTVVRAPIPNQAQAAVLRAATSAQ